MRRAYWKLLGAVAVAGMMGTAACGGDDEPAQASIECGPNTVLEDGECIPEDRCEDDEIVTPRGVCESEDIFCDEGTAYDAEREECVSLADVVCGEGTIEENGQCVVEDPLYCGDDTVLVDETCELTDEVCGEGTELDEVECQPDEDACQQGSQWDVSARECVDLEVVTCGETTVEVDDRCVPMETKADELAADADIEFADGEPIVPSEDDSFVFTGALDDELEQTFEIDGEQGQWLEITVYPRGLPSPAFSIGDSTGDWLRATVAGMHRLPSRVVAVPDDDTFELDVTTHLSDSDYSPAFGDETWQYVGVVDVVEAPEPYQWDYEDDVLDGNLRHTKYNFIEIDVDDTEEMIFEPEMLGEDAQEVSLEVWESTDEFSQRFDVEVGDDIAVDVADHSAIYFHLDAVEFYGEDTGFELEAFATEIIEPGDYYRDFIEADAGDVIFLSHVSDQAQTMEGRVYRDDELLYEVDEVLASNESSYLTSETKREFFYADESAEYEVQLENPSSSEVTGFISTSYADQKPTLTIDEDETAELETSLDADGAEQGDWKFAVVDTSVAAAFDISIDIDSGTTPNARIYDTERNQIESVTNSSGTTEIDFIAEEPGVYFVAILPGFTAIEGDMEIEMQGRAIEILEPGEQLEIPYDVDTFDILNGEITYEEGDEFDARLVNPDGVLVFEQTGVSLGGFGEDDELEVMELFPGPGEFVLELENTGDSTMLDIDADVQASETYDIVEPDEGFQFDYERESVEAGTSEFLLMRPDADFVVDVQALMDVDEEGLLRGWDLETMTRFSEQEDTLSVDTSFTASKNSTYAIEMSALTDLSTGYDLSMEGTVVELIEETREHDPYLDISEATTKTSTLSLDACAEIVDLRIIVDLYAQFNGEAYVDLWAPGQSDPIRLRSGFSGNPSGGDVAVYPDETTPHESLDELVGEPGGGVWELDVENDPGTWSPGTMELYSWSVEATCQN